MITCKLYGRRANQMFQIASTIGIAMKNAQPFYLPIRTVNEEAFPSATFPLLNAGNFYKDTNNLDFKGIFYHEPTHAYKEVNVEQFPNIEGGICLDGYFQSYKYFEEHLNFIRTLLNFHPNYAFTDKGAIHIRRGDYVNLQDKHPVLPLAYYKNAINVAVSKGITIFNVYSDDIPWCIQNLTLDRFNVTFHFKTPEPGNELKDMYEMANHSVIIIANSSFSLFAALMNFHKATVISPYHGNWFGPGNSHLDTSDLLPSNFIELSY
jgi:hypothetical protein